MDLLIIDARGIPAEGISDQKDNEDVQKAVLVMKGEEKGSCVRMNHHLDGIDRACHQHWIQLLARPACH